MREISFRGKRLDNGEWVYGYVFDDDSVFQKRFFVGALVVTDAKGTTDDVFDIGINFFEVDSSTVGQYTGLTDKNGVKIFDGDILRVNEPEFIPVSGVVRFGEYDFNVGFFVEWLNDRIFYRHDIRYWVERPYCAVRGNIHDNPELLK